MISNFLSKKLIELNLGRRNKLAALANYVPFYIYENLLFISGQLPIENDQLKFQGKIDTDMNTIEQSESIVLTTTNLLWTLSDAIDNSQNPVHTFDSIVGVYQITLVTTHANGCTDTTFRQLWVNDEYYIYIPSSFTPDWDGMNDKLCLYYNAIRENTFDFKSH